MKFIRIFFFVFVVAFALSGCKKPLQHPELADPVYSDIKKDANTALAEFKVKQKDILAAKKAFDEAPIRTGQRLDAEEEYFSLVNSSQKITEKYRYLALKAESQKKKDRLLYPEYFKDNRSWPDPAEYQDYEVEKRLANAPREWNEDKRAKEREVAQEKAKNPPSAASSHEE